MELQVLEQETKEPHMVRIPLRSVPSQMGPCTYCGQTYHERAAPVHFIPCKFCESLEHAGCCH